MAVKVLHRELTAIPDLVARFEREAMAAANIDHPNVAAATDFGKLEDGCLFLVLEYVEGKNLRDEIALGAMPVERALHIARQIAGALGAAHAQGIVHRDLKPENVMLIQKGDNTDWVKVLDFGIAKVPIGEVATASGEPITRAGMVFGTPEYMAPEQALGQTVDGRADLYALGVILFEMLSSVRPFSGASTVGVLGQQLAGSPPRLSERAPGIRVPATVEEIVKRLIDKDRDHRLGTADLAQVAIEAALVPIPRGRGVQFTLSDGSASEVAELPVPQAIEPRAVIPTKPAWLRSGVLVVVGASLSALVYGITSWKTTEQEGVAPSPPVESAASVSRKPKEVQREPAEEAGGPLEVARASASQDPQRAVVAVGGVLTADPKVSDDPRASELLFILAQQPASADQAFSLLTGPMGPRGAEVLWDLAGDPAVQIQARQRAARWLRSQAFQERATPALRLAAELRTANSCEAARALLPRARREADRRSLSQLFAWQKTSGCGKKRQDDCMPCLRQDDQLEQAISAIQARAGHSP